jgi:2-phospho-L-lactate guanylyltransferase
MTLWAIIPVKPLRRGKSRLAGVLSEDERTLLNFTMLGNLLKTINEVSEIDGILVISRDPAALALAREHGARTVMEEGKQELNTALRRATIVAQTYSAQEILVLPADLPLVQPIDIHTLLDYRSKAPEILIAPDRRKEGTNALYINPAGILDYCYGPGSFNTHKRQAEKYGVKVTVCVLEAFSLDLDFPEDLDLLRSFEPASMNI